MSYLVLYAENSLSRVRLHHEDDNVPAECICWYVDGDAKVNRAIARIKKYWLSGSIHEKGALLVIDQAEAHEHLRVALGPSLEEQIEVKEASHSKDTVPWAVILLVSIGSICITAIWFTISTIALSAIFAAIGALFVRGLTK